MYFRKNRAKKNAIDAPNNIPIKAYIAPRNGPNKMPDKIVAGVAGTVIDVVPKAMSVIITTGAQGPVPSTNVLILSGSSMPAFCIKKIITTATAIRKRMRNDFCATFSAKEVSRNSTLRARSAARDPLRDFLLRLVGRMIRSYCLSI